jgi:hypothetical protein
LNRQDYIEAVRKLVPGELPLGEPDIILAISQGLKTYSRHKPRRVVEDVAGDGGFDYPVSGLGYWSDEFSVVKQIEYPVDDTDQTADLLLDEQWHIYEKPAGKTIRFLDEKPASDESFRVTYTGLHTCTDGACTIPSIDEEAVQALCASNFADMLSTYFAQTGDSTIEADVVDHKSKSEQYSSRAKALRKFYYDHIGIKEGVPRAACVTHDQDKAPSWGADRLTHKRKER